MRRLKILIWGFGNYYRKKKSDFSDDIILAFVSSKETGTYEGINIISPVEILQYSFDKIYLMAGESLLEMLEILRKLKFKEWDKVTIGWGVRPYVDDEDILFEDGKINCNSEGMCIYTLDDQVTVINNWSDLRLLKQQRIRSGRGRELYDIPIEPISRIFGIDRGCPIDRYYIEKFLKENSHYIRGIVLEVAERTYTKKYGVGVEKSYVINMGPSAENDSIVINLETGEGVINGIADCFILTQTLPFIFDVKKAAENTVRLLKEGGIALITVSGITQISRYDMDRWGHYWSFTTASLKRVFEECNNIASVEVKAYGNVKSAASGLYGLATEEMNQKSLEYQDDDYQQLITAVVKKQQSKNNRSV